MRSILAIAAARSSATAGSSVLLGRWRIGETIPDRRLPAASPGDIIRPALGASAGLMRRRPSRLDAAGHGPVPPPYRLSAELGYPPYPPPAAWASSGTNRAALTVPTPDARS